MEARLSIDDDFDVACIRDCRLFERKQREYRVELRLGKRESVDFG
jgi:hypothetical protein